MTNNPIPFIKDNMQESEFLSVIFVGIGKAFVSVLLILGAIFASAYLVTLGNFQVYAITALAIGSFVIIYIYESKITTIKEFFINNTIPSWKNHELLTYSMIMSYILTGGFIFLWQIILLMWTAWYDPLSQAILKIFVISAVSTVFFVFAKRDEVWEDHIFNLPRFGHYLLMGITFGIGTYLLGGIIVLSSELIGGQLTFLGIGLEIIFASVYTYMDLQYWVDIYKQKQMTSEEYAKKRQEEEDTKQMVSRLHGKYGNV
jgi:hypothetical protein